MNLHCGLELGNNNPIKYGWKKIISSVDVVKTVISDYISPHCDPELEDSKPIFLQDTLAQDDASPYQLTTEEILMGQYSCKEKQKQKNFKQVYSPLDGNVAVSRECDRHAADAYLIPRYGMVFFSQSSSNAVSYLSLIHI